MPDEAERVSMLKMLAEMLSEQRGTDSSLGRATTVLSEEAAEAPTVDTTAPEATEAGTQSTTAPAAEGLPTAATVEQPLSEETRPRTKTTKTADEMEQIVIEGLRQMEGFPSSGAKVTVYGYSPWNVLLTFGPYCTSSQQAARFRAMLPRLVDHLRESFDVKMPK